MSKYKVLMIGSMSRERIRISKNWENGEKWFHSYDIAVRVSIYIWGDSVTTISFSLYSYN